MRSKLQPTPLGRNVIPSSQRAMPPLPSSRRHFCATAAAALITPQLLHAQAATSRPNVAAIDHDRILAAAAKALVESPGTLLAVSRQVSILAAAFYLTHDEKYAARAALHLQAWFVAPATRLPTDPTPPGAIRPSFTIVVDGTPLAEIAQSLPFLARSEAFTPRVLKEVKAWFAGSLDWLITSRTAGLARDQKDHHALSWLLQATAAARLTANEPVLAELRHRFKTVTLRAQLVAAGTFPHELPTPWPYRNSLFALDLLAACCLLLSTQFESLWEYELQDGPGLQVAIARHAPYIRDRRAWPYPADLDHFNDLPVRHPSLLFAARAYNRPEYAALWQTLNPDPIPELQPTFPISQPLLWTARL